MGHVALRSLNHPSGAEAEGKEDILASLDVGKDVCRARVHPKKTSILAVGGKEHDLAVWDLETIGKDNVKPIFKAKNVCHTTHPFPPARAFPKH